MDISEESEHFFRVSLLLLNVGGKTFRKKMQSLPSYVNFEDFLSSRKHALYHLWHPKPCKCPPNPVRSGGRPKCRFSKGQQHLNRAQWESLYRLQISLCACRDSCECMNPSSDLCLCAEKADCCCIYHHIPGVEVEILDLTLAGTILRNSDELTDSEMALITNLMELRNKVYGHTEKASLSILEFNKFWTLISNDIKSLANTCDDTGSFELEIVGDIKYVESTVLDATNTNRILTFWKECAAQLNEIVDSQKHLHEEQRQIRKKQARMGMRLDVLYEKHSLVCTEMKEVKEDINQRCYEKHKDHVSERLISNTNLVLENHKSSALYVRQTDVFEEARARLNANHMLILSGIGGRGKTSMAYELMVEMTKADSRYSPVIVNEPSQWDEVVDGQNHLVVFIDDICGKTNIDNNALAAWEKRFEIMFSCAKRGNVRLVIGTRNGILLEGKSTFEKYDMFKSDHTLDLSSPGYDLKYHDKIELFERYCEEKRVHISQSLVTKPNRAHKEINEIDIHQIAHTNTLVGFPQLCKLFFSNESFFKKGVNFFLHASDELVIQISSLRRSDPLVYSILCYTLLRESKLNLENIDRKLLNNICATLQISPPDDTVVCEIAYQMSVTYLDVSPFSKLVFMFKHVTIMEAVLKSMVNFYPEFVLSNADPEVIHSYFRSSRYSATPGEICWTVPSKLDEMLAAKLLDDKISDLQMITQHPTFSDSNFITSFLKQAYEKNKIDKILLSSCSFGHTDQANNVFQSIVEMELRQLKSFKPRFKKPLSTDTLYAALLFSVNSRQSKFDVFVTIVKLFEAYQISINSQILLKLDSIYETDPLYEESYFILLAAIFQKFDEVKYLLLREDIDLGVSDTEGNTILHLIVMNGWVDLVKEVLEKDRSLLDRANNNMITPLLLAASITPANEEVVRQLIRHKANMTLKDSKGNSLLHFLALGYNLSLIDEFKCDAGFRGRNSEGETPLLYSLNQSQYLDYPDFEKLKFLIQHSDSKSLRDKNGNTFLHLLAGKHFDASPIEVIEFSLEKDNTLLNKWNDNCETPAVLAAKRGDFHYLRELLNNFDIDLTLSDKKGNTILHYLAQHSRINLIHNVLDKQMELLHTKNRAGQNAFMFALGHQSHDLISLSCTFIEYGIDLKATDNIGNNVLHYATKLLLTSGVESGVMEKIFSVNVDLENERNTYHQTPLLYALSQFDTREHGSFQIKWPRVSRLFLSDRCSMSSTDMYGNTLLHYLAKFGILLESPKTWLQIKNLYNQDVLMYAACHGFCGESFIKSYLAEDLCQGTDAFGRSILHYAALHFWPDIIDIILKRSNCKLNVHDNAGDTPLMLGLVHGDNTRDVKSSETFLLLLKNGGVITVGRDRNTFLHQYASRFQASEEIVSYVLTQDKSALNRRNCFGCTPAIWHLLFRSKQSNFASGSIVPLNKELIRSANLNIADGLGNTVFHHCMHIPDLSIVPIVTERYPQAVNLKNSNGETPLMFAAIARRGVEAITELLRFSDLSISDVNGNSLLHYCMRNGWTEVVECILELDPTLLDFQNNFGQTPLLFGLSELSINAFEQREKLECAMRVLDYSFEVSVVDSIGNSILHYAALHYCLPLVKKIVENNQCLASLRNMFGQTPILCLMDNSLYNWGEAKDTLNVLLKYENDIMHPDYTGMNLQQYCTRSVIQTFFRLRGYFLGN